MRVLAPLLLLLPALALALALNIHAAAADDSMPPPFYRVLYLTSPYMTGDDVTVAQALLARDAAVLAAGYAAEDVRSGAFDETSDAATRVFQEAHGLQVDGSIGQQTAQMLLDVCYDDGFRDDGVAAAEIGEGYLYKINIRVSRNRSVETNATLYDAANNAIFSFRARTHGLRDDAGSYPWPDYSYDYGLQEFASNGNTPTGLIELDLNSPEPDPETYGPYPVNRLVRGYVGDEGDENKDIQSNGNLLLPNIRDGLLIHTGEWPDWDASMPMPNSDGCIHISMDDQERLIDELVNLGVEVRDNPFSGKDYPYDPQGLLAIQYVDNDPYSTA